MDSREEAAPMRKKTRRDKSIRTKTKLGLPDLEYAKSAVLVSLRSPESQRSYRRSIDDFVRWYCSEPRLFFNKTVVTRYRIFLEEQLLAPGTINVRLAAVCRLAYEAADTGLLSPELAAGIRRVKGSKKLGVRLGNRLTVEEARALWQIPSAYSLKGKRDRAILAVLLGCGLFAQRPPQKMSSTAGLHANQLHLQIRGEGQQLGTRTSLADHHPAS